MKQNTGLAAKWTGLIRECQTSGLTIKEFAEQNRVGVGSLYAWSKRLGVPLKSETGQMEMNFIELGSIQSPVRNTELYPVELGAGGITIKTEMPLIQIVAFIKEFA